MHPHQHPYQQHPYQPHLQQQQQQHHHHHHQHQHQHQLQQNHQQHQQNLVKSLEQHMEESLRAWTASHGPVGAAAAAAYGAYGGFNAQAQALRGESLATRPHRPAQLGSSSLTRNYRIPFATTVSICHGLINCSQHVLCSLLK